MGSGTFLEISLLTLCHPQTQVKTLLCKEETIAEHDTGGLPSSLG